MFGCGGAGGEELTLPSHTTTKSFVRPKYKRHPMDALGAFTEVRVLGEGAQARASLVERADTGERYCKKTFFAAASSQAAIREVEILCRCAHPNITRVIACFRPSEKGAGADATSLSILMEYADGGSLAEAIQSRAATTDAPFDEHVILGWFAQIVSAISYLHSQSILHRDLKSANVFLTMRGLVKVGDFGIAKVLDTSQGDRLAQTCIGTPYYLAPELVSGDGYGLPADVWALGVLLYEMTALRRPFEAKNLPALALKITRVDYPPLPSSRPRALREMVGLLLQREPSARPSAATLAAAPLIRHHLAKLQAELRSLAALGASVAHAVPDTGAAACSRSSTAPAAPPTSSGSPASTAPDLSLSPPPPPPPPSNGCDGASTLESRHGERAAACAIRVQSMLTPPPVASPRDAGADPADLGANVRFATNLHALEMNLQCMEQSGEVLSAPSKSTPLRAPLMEVQGADKPPSTTPTTPLSSSLSPCVSTRRKRSAPMSTPQQRPQPAAPIPSHAIGTPLASSTPRSKTERSAEVARWSAKSGL